MPKGTIESVSWALELIEQLGRSTEPMFFTDIVAVTARPKSSVHRMLATLVHHGFVEKLADVGPYRLGSKLWALGLNALGDRNLARTARPHLRRLMLMSEETVNLVVLLEGDASIMYVDKIDGPKMVHVNSPVGLISPSWCTATGRSMLAHRRESWDQVLSGPLKKLTPHTVNDPKELRAILEKVAATGYAVAKGERGVEHGGIAAAIRDHSGDVVGSCGLALPAFRMSRALVNRCIPMVVETAAAISKALGSHSPDQRAGRRG